MRARRHLRHPIIRRSALAAAIAAAALILSGCTFFPGATGTTRTEAAHTAEAVPSELKPFYEQSLTWKKLSGGIDSS